MRATLDLFIECEGGLRQAAKCTGNLDDNHDR
jgi:hypothetical protein